MQSAPESASESAAWTDQDLDADPHRFDDKADRVRSMFGAIAGRYDLNNRLHSFGQDQRWRRAAVRLAAVTSTDDILDVACGTGDLTEAFARALPRSVTGLDFTPEMLDVARVKHPRRERPAGEPTPVYLEGDATALPFDDASFDVLSIAFGIRNVGEPARALAEFRRVLRPGGRLVILEFAEPRNAVLRGLNRLYTHRIMPLTASLIARDRSGAYKYLPRSVETFLDPAHLRAAIETAGFSDPRERSLTFGVCRAHVATVASSPGHD